MEIKQREIKQDSRFERVKKTQIDPQVATLSNVYMYSFTCNQNNTIDGTNKTINNIFKYIQYVRTPRYHVIYMPLLFNHTINTIATKRSPRKLFSSH
jgi:hypothetical protein